MKDFDGTQEVTRQMLVVLDRERDFRKFCGWKKIIVVTILIGMTAALFSGCATRPEGDWSKRDTWMQVAVTAALAADAYTTSKIQYDPQLEEIGFARHFLGAQPTTTDTWMYFGTAMLSSYLITRWLPPRLRPWFQGSVILVEAKVVANNCEGGLCP